jgi:rod shape-determining protein MreB
VVEATMQAGAKAAYVVREPVLAAIGAGIPINTPAGNMIINIGGGTAEIAVISMGGVVACESVRVGGMRIDEAISEYIKQKYGLVVGEKTSEEIKIKLGSATIVEEEKTFEIRGRDLVSGLPKTIELTTNMLVSPIIEPVKEIIHAIRNVFQNTPPDLSADIMDKGLVLSGGTALLRNLDLLITQKTGVSCVVADDPLLCVAKGTGSALGNINLYKRAIQNK